ncbi:methylated-DNA--[protein]-cysteine S-methyltransferase [Demequina activiva]|uniref:methylated-DNA--[protein]-cysteine S-methyltransferase n=1 Tax=Demequina activiva TaxID=1582364 RepID=A0A919Q3Q1_9MICO|nr:methylated-DNA--[protein]-cysteine S-methyltransferase [Demequina activiva]GIG55019.1 methylated-DNA--protein-cysteine methyltransferase [Demequina activiva]
MLTYETLDTPDGPFTVVEADAAVVAAGWSADADELLARSRHRGEAASPGAVASADAVRAYYDGDADAVAATRIGPVGTEFRVRVWDALHAIPAGETRTYGEVAAALGSPNASRAVGAACGANAIALFIPCHRVTGAYGALTGFAWGVDVKRSLLERERARLAVSSRSDAP